MGKKFKETENGSGGPTLFVQVSSGQFIDLNKEFTWHGNFTNRQKRFIFLKAYVFTDDSRGTNVECARQAGYSKNGAGDIARKMLKNPIFVSEIESIKVQGFNEDVKSCDKENENDPQPLFVKLDSGDWKDLNQEFSWDSKLTDGQKRFVFFYAYPFNNRLRGKGTESAIKAGYSEDIAEMMAGKMLLLPNIVSEIKKIQGKDFDEDIKSQMRKDVVIQKQNILYMNVGDYYNIETIVTKDGEKYTKATAKPWCDLSDEQQMMVEDIEVDPKGIVHYKLPRKTSVANEILKLCKAECKEKDDSGFDVKATYDLIKGKIETKVEEIKKRREEDDSDFCYTPPEAAAQQER